MTFSELFDALEYNTIENNIDRKIVEKILEAERNWIIPVSNLNVFLDLIEEEIGDKATKINLSNLLNQYMKTGFENSAWNTESICSLLELFELVQLNDLKSVFNYISNKYNLAN